MRLRSPNSPAGFAHGEEVLRVSFTDAVPYTYYRISPARIAPYAPRKRRMPAYRTAPVPSDRMPPGIPYIIGNEAAERFSYYGMRGILYVFMTQHLLNRNGQLETMDPDTATTWFHVFMAANYFFPLLGGWISDVYWGKYRTIIALSIVYCLGHLALALDVTRLGLLLGLTLIAFGAGGIKPCVSAHVGDQFGERNKHLLPKVFSWFYFSINLGAFIATILIPKVLDAESWPDSLAGYSRYAAHVAFGIPGLLMLIATIVFWMGRNKFVHIPPARQGFIEEAKSPEGKSALKRLGVLYLFVMIFWALYDQTGSSWVEQAKHMDRTYQVPIGFLPDSWRAWLTAPDKVDEPEQPAADDAPPADEAAPAIEPPDVWEVDVLPAQVGAINPILILFFIPLFTYVVFPAINRVFPLTPLRKISIGFFIAALSFCIPAVAQAAIVGGETPDLNWQIAAFFVITAAEVMVSITCLEFSYTQAPPKLKSLVMSLYLLSVSAGNMLVAGVNWVLGFLRKEQEGERLASPGYFWFFAGLMLTAAVIFVFVARRFREKTYIQQEGGAEE